jgi:hypothetical protein
MNVGVLNLGVLARPCRFFAFAPLAQSNANLAAACSHFLTLIVLVVFEPGMAKQMTFNVAHLAHIDSELLLRRISHAPPLAQLGFERRGAPAAALVGVTQKGGGVELDMELPLLHGVSYFLN